MNRGYDQYYVIITCASKMGWGLGGSILYFCFMLYMLSRKCAIKCIVLGIDPSQGQHSYLSSKKRIMFSRKAKKKMAINTWLNMQFIFLFLFFRKSFVQYRTLNLFECFNNTLFFFLHLLQLIQKTQLCCLLSKKKTSNSSPCEDLVFTEA